MTDDHDAGPSSTDTAERRASPRSAPTGDGAGLNEAEQDLKATAESIRNDLVRLAELETAKQEIDPSDPRLDHLAKEAVDLAERIQRETRIEQELSRELR